MKNIALTILFFVLCFNANATPSEICWIVEVTHKNKMKDTFEITSATEPKLMDKKIVAEELVHECPTVENITIIKSFHKEESKLSNTQWACIVFVAFLLVYLLGNVK